MTPPLLVQLQCPKCGESHWVIDSDFRAMYLAGEPDLSYEQRTYGCPACGVSGPGYQVLQKSPSEFLLQPHSMYPMHQADFDRWAAILAENFPDSPRVAEIGRSFRPNTDFERQRLEKERMRAEERRLNALYESGQLPDKPTGQ